MNREFSVPAPQNIYSALLPCLLWAWRRRRISSAFDRWLFFSYVFAKFQTSLTDSDKIHKETHPESQTIPTFLTLYIFAFLFQLLLVFDALRAKNTIQVIGLCMFNVALLLYAAIQLTQIRDAVNSLAGQGVIKTGVWNAVKPFLIAVLCIIALGFVLMVVAAWKLYDEFAWTIYKEISADLRMKRRYLTYQVPFPMEYHSLLPCWTVIQDLYRPSKVWFLLLPWFYHSIRGYRGTRQTQRRVRIDTCRHTRHDYHNISGRIIYPQGE